MRTSELIRALAADCGFRAIPPGRALALVMVPAAAAASGILLAAFGLRPDLFSSLGEPRVMFKLGGMLLLVFLSGSMALRLVKPGASVRRHVLRLAIVPVLLAGAILVELIAVPPALWAQKLTGTDALVCLASIPFLAALPLCAALLAMRQGAPEHPRLAGAAAGLFAGAIGALLYATHCPNDSPLYVAVWYLLAIGIVVNAGAAAGGRLLRW
ncbi:MAG TPA: DUF1109 domain-containing protein [Methylocella sp.]|nr:DUF1109 domain-containing protein [Methylocella sp.]